MAVLALDIGGTPRQWVSHDMAIVYQAKGAVAWSLGEVIAKYRGGVQNNGNQSYLETPSIIAIKGHGFNPARQGRVTLTNKTLFGRDRHICAYCGEHFPNAGQLSRDHIIPRSKGGIDDWMNVVSACKRCNTRKGSKSLKEAKLELIYVPYVPNHFENLILQNRNILADQMEYLLAGVPKHSRVILNS
jgi:5-methylcytosine-specific restriction endonuclease McrA